MNQKLPIYGLTLRHPWPFAIVHLGKRIENRAYPPSRTPQQERRPELDRSPFYVALHGGTDPYKARSADRDQRVAEYEEDVAYLHEHFPETIQYGQMILPGIVGVAGVHGRRLISGPKTPASDFWYSGPFGWQLERLRVFERPVEARGGPGLWPITATGDRSGLYEALHRLMPDARRVA